ncbi:hypothetical protein LMG667_03355 [Xanthomonas euvesicatoria]|uniref:hypothetical protein n=1 Tax=Xanthomonas euvesicatoria TaxID=456327 RepID=UPI00080E7000|nr:hypothetical protein [Xanthomonas euvesicatoria]OCG90022.1 hypothetical protein LMG667_03355 [Xanthomonas euvesicatoria]
MSNIQFREGPYHYAAPGDLIDKKFESGDGGARHFKIVVASAYNAGGLIGSEHNGVAVLDVDRGTVVTERWGEPYNVAHHHKIASTLASADWAQFTAGVKSSPGYRNLGGDLDAAAPDFVYPLLDEENWVVLDVESEGPYTYPARRRVDVINALCTHSVHSERYGPFRLSWDIKVRSYDDSGRQPDGDHGNEERFDALWQKQLEKDGSAIFARACEDALSQYMEGNYSVYPGIEQGHYHFETEGRSGGHLVLSKVDGLPKLSWDNQHDMREALMELDRDELAKLYKAVRNLDTDLEPAKISAEMAYQMSFIRSTEEEEWKEMSEDELEEALEGSSLRP